MTALNKQALREAAQEEIMLRSVSDTSDAWQDEASPEAVLALLDELEAAEKRIAELSASHSKLRDTMATIHNTIRMDGGYTPLAAILNAAKRAHEESATAAGIGVKGE
ncbi:TPA: ead/Ea22-like family protein [Citrobacter freundii]|nr:MULTISPECIES: ead/Ea22-like family protein [Citrobacter]MDH0751228.1 ead/Ea22-like family protein [Citrobacter freundii]MDH1025838.1 ead/Ea22-like family protein [Citrobacter freundii]MDH1923045.1 ead/Ea22-like family protein [Citrobacter freundii]MDM3135661.1 ead/Ea22-like family protein [Citrobacter sp. Cf123]MDM3164993.1 ead/Ea22-like family protein [Citrobacter sp. Cf117]